jgi:dipeptidyl aminopeptidase/acylaminoacyl peptidase
VLCLLTCERFLFFGSTKENGNDILIYCTRLKDSHTGARNDSGVFSLPSKLVGPAMGEDTTRWVLEAVSPNDQLLLLTMMQSSNFRPLYVVDISQDGIPTPERIVLPGCTEKDEETYYDCPGFSKDPDTPNLIYVITNGYGDFTAVVAYDLASKDVLHITTPEAHLISLRPIPREVEDIEISREYLYFRANMDGWGALFVMPLTGEYKNTILEVIIDWEGGSIDYYPNEGNGRPHELAVRLVSYKSRGHLARLDITKAIQYIKEDENGGKFILASPENYRQAATTAPEFTTHPPKLITFKSFDGLVVPAFYYHPTEGKTITPVVVGIHGGPEGQATTRYRVYVQAAALCQEAF